MKTFKQFITESTDAEYQTAVESKDTAAQQRIVDEAAKAAGYDVVGFHGTDKVFTQFQNGRTFFSPSQTLATKWAKVRAGKRGTPVVQKTLLRLNNPYRFTNEMGDQQAFLRIADSLQKQGYDGTILTDEKTGEVRELSVFDLSQIKSADAITRDDQGNVIPLDERFNKSNPDIRY